MLVVHDNFVTLPAIARELALPESWHCVTTTQGDMSSNIHQVLLP